MKRKRVGLKKFFTVSFAVFILTFGTWLVYDTMGPDCSFVHANHGVNSPEFGAYHIRRCAVKDKSPYDGLYW